MGLPHETSECTLCAQAPVVDGLPPTPETTLINAQHDLLIREVRAHKHEMSTLPNTVQSLIGGALRCSSQSIFRARAYYRSSWEAISALTTNHMLAPALRGSAKFYLTGAKVACAAKLSLDQEAGYGHSRRRPGYRQALYSEKSTVWRSREQHTTSRSHGPL